MCKKKLQIFALFLICISLHPSIAIATAFTVTFEDGADTYPIGTSFPPESILLAETTDPTGIFSNKVVYFKGPRDGAAANAGFLSSSIDRGFMYRYRLDFDHTVKINEIIIEGDTFYAPSTWQDNLYLLDAQKNIVGSRYTAWKSEYTSTYTLNLLNAIGQTFYLEEYDIAGIFNMRSSINVSYQDIQIVPVPLPSSFILLLSGASILLLRKRLEFS